ncbi:MAG TPA: hypothetical protein VGN04_09015 [Herbaspirillum sp.]|jgi:hypothetical protein
MTIGGCTTSPLPAISYQSAALKQPSATLSKRGLGRTRYVAIDYPNVAPFSGRPLGRNNASMYANPSGGRVLYSEQNRMRDLATLTHAKNELDKYRNLNRNSLTRIAAMDRLAEIGSIRTRIETLAKRVMHTDPSSTETDKFQREANTLKSLVQNQINAETPKRAQPRMTPPKTVKSSPICNDTGYGSESSIGSSPMSPEPKSILALESASSPASTVVENPRRMRFTIPKRIKPAPTGRQVQAKPTLVSIPENWSRVQKTEYSSRLWHAQISTAMLY